jgi:hypothetical protein
MVHRSIYFEVFTSIIIIINVIVDAVIIVLLCYDVSNSKLRSSDLNVLDSIPERGIGISSSPPLLGRFYDPPSLLSNGYQELCPWE